MVVRLEVWAEALFLFTRQDVACGLAGRDGRESLTQVRELESGADAGDGILIILSERNVFGAEL